MWRTSSTCPSVTLGWMRCFVCVCVCVCVCVHVCACVLCVLCMFIESHYRPSIVFEFLSENTAYEGDQT